MAYAIKLFLVVLVLCAVAMPLLRKPFAGLLSPRDYKRAWLVIFGAAVVSFLSGKPIFFVMGVAIIAIVATSLFGTGAKGRLAAFWMMILLFPPISVSPDGFGGINAFLDLDAERILVLVLLLPAAISLLGKPQARVPSTLRAMDFLVMAYPMLRIVAALPSSTMTTSLRSIVVLLIDVVLPYYVTTRGIRSADELKFVASRMALGCVYMACVALLESVVHRNLYSELQSVYGLRWQLTYRLMRGSFLRVQATTAQPIILAFVMTFGFGLWAWLRTISGSTVFRGRVVAILLFVALLATWSRGPLLGFVAFGLCVLALRWMAPMKFLVLLSAFLVLAIVASTTGADQYAYDALQAIFGSGEGADMSSIDYRRKLLETSLALIKQSPVWGVPNYAYYLQDLRQGEGIVDLVNTYIAVALSNGLVGLALFLAPHFVVIYLLLRRASVLGSRPRFFGGSFPLAMIAVTVAALLIIFTTSNYSMVTPLLLFLVAVPSSWIAMSAEERALADAPTPSEDKPDDHRPLAAYAARSPW